MRAWIGVALAAGVAAACSFDSAGGTSRSSTADAAIAAPDGGEADAGPECAGDDDCAVSPGLCQLAGTCDVAQGRCVFPEVDCTTVADDCNVGVCDAATGECRKRPAFESTPCGVGTECAVFADCGEFDAADACDETGTQSRECMDFTCVVGQCLATARVETQDCQRDQDGVACADTVCPGEFGTCEFAELCHHEGSQSRDCTANTCLDAACTSAPIVETRACSRPVRTGLQCADPECGDFTSCAFDRGNVCDETGLRERVCTPFTCADQACVAGALVVQELDCTRDTDDVVCGELCEMGPGSCIDVMCVDGLCPVE